MSGSNWPVGQTECDGKVATCCFRTDISADRRAALPNQFIVEWQFTNAKADGLPAKDEYAMAEAFENEIRERLEDADAAILAVISTGNGYRELYFYRADPQLLARRFNAVAKGRDLPVELHAGSDPDWQVYSELVSPFA